MTHKTYVAGKEAIKKALIKAGAIGIAAGGFVVLANSNKSGYTRMTEIVIFTVISILFFAISFFTDSGMRSYEVRTTEVGLSRTNFKGCFDYEIKWTDIELILFGQVLDRYNRWDVWFEGIEIRHKSEFGSPDKSVYKLEHIINAEAFMVDVKEMCALHNIQFSDVRPSADTNSEM